MTKLLLVVALISVWLAQLHALPAVEKPNVVLAVADVEASDMADSENADLKSAESIGFGFYPGLYGYGGGFGGGYGYGYGSRWGYRGYHGYGGYGGYYQPRHIYPVWG